MNEPADWHFSDVCVDGANILQAMAIACVDGVCATWSVGGGRVMKVRATFHDFVGSVRLSFGVLHLISTCCRGRSSLDAGDDGDAVVSDDVGEVKLCVERWRSWAWICPRRPAVQPEPTGSAIHARNHDFGFALDALPCPHLTSSDDVQHVGVMYRP